MKNVTVHEGQPAQFKTQVTGKPKPTIQWFREGALIPQSPDFEVSRKLVGVQVEHIERWFDGRFFFITDDLRW